VLTQLQVKNLAVLAGAEVEFGPGLNVLTGETGAGKSIVVDSLALLAGARAASDLIREGAETLTVTGVFEPSGTQWRQVLADAGLEAEEGVVVVRREINREGRNRVFVNDQPATLRLLGELAPFLLRLHGQREELGLIEADLQRDWLDRSAGAEGGALLDKVGELYETYSRLAARLARLQGDERLRHERLDLLRFQAQEIDGARLRAGEEDELRAERLVLRHVEAIRAGLASAASLLEEDDGAAVERLARASQALDAISEFEPQAREWAAEVQEARIRAEEVARSLESRLDAIEADPGRLDQVEERLAALERLFRKHGATSAAILARRQEIGAELEELGGDEAQRGELEQKTAAALRAYRDAAIELSQLRARTAAALAAKVEEELRDLALARARFSVEVARQPRHDSPLEVEGAPVEFGLQGIDRVTFYLAPNPGEAARPIARAASGGELSRLYLAVQLASGGATIAGDATLVFDEVDAGIGGAEAEAVGRKLRRLARKGQILAVTHLPQVASCGNLHFRVAKRVAGGRTFAEVHRLDAPGRIEEVARMLAGKKVTASSLSHAEELLAAAERGRG
jgi:DNA repair protein RecN (Recombination protein N)